MKCMASMILRFSPCGHCGVKCSSKRERSKAVKAYGEIAYTANQLKHCHCDEGVRELLSQRAGHCDCREHPAPFTPVFEIVLTRAGGFCSSSSAWLRPTALRPTAFCRLARCP